MTGVQTCALPICTSQEEHDELKSESESSISSVSSESASSESSSSSKASSSSKSSSSSKNSSSVKELTHKEQSDKSSSESDTSKTSAASSEQSTSAANSTKENMQSVSSASGAASSTVSVNEESEKISTPSEVIKEPEPQSAAQPQQSFQNNTPPSNAISRSGGNALVPISGTSPNPPATSSVATPPQTFTSSEDDLSGLQNLSEVSDTETTPEQAAGDTRTAYWTNGGKSYHFSENCTSLKRSKNINRGTVQEAVNKGKSDPCNLCANG